MKKGTHPIPVSFFQNPQFVILGFYTVIKLQP